MRTETKNVQYLYDDGSEAHFMNEETYDQFAIPTADLKDELQYMQPNTTVQILDVNGKPSSIQLPGSVELASPRPSRGSRATPPRTPTKTATLETGVVINVPLFINVGDVLKVDPKEGRYISRA